MQNELKANPLFDPAKTELDGDIKPDESNLTFSFGVQLSLKRPIKP